MAFKKAVELIIAPPGGFEGVTISDLDMEFDITRSTTIAENTAEFTIFGANKTTRNEILVQDAPLQFSAGYADSGGAGLIFRGNVVEAVPEKLATTWAMHITASSVKRGTLTATPVTLTYAPDTRVTDVINDIAALLNMVVYGARNADTVTLPNGLAECTTARNALNYLEEILKFNGKGIFRDNDEIIIFNQGKDSDFDIVPMSYDRGLITLSEFKENEEKKRSKTGSDARDNIVQVDFTTLLYPQIRPNGIIQFSGVDSALDGNYTPTTIKYIGDTRDGPFNCIGRADKL